LINPSKYFEDMASSSLVSAVMAALQRAADSEGKHRDAAIRRVYEVISTHTNDTQTVTRHYEVIASFLAKNPIVVQQFCGICFPLFGNRFFSPLFAALSYRWIFEAGGSLARLRFSVFIDGVMFIFAQDADSETKRFEPVFRVMQI
jgi:hypothetical protein